MKPEIVEKIKKAIEKPKGGRNIMGASEDYYNSYYMIGKCFSEAELSFMSEECINNLIKLADFATEVFY